MVGYAIRRLELIKWHLEESPSREQVVAWQRTVFQPIHDWCQSVDPGVSEANVSQVCRYFADFAEVWIEFREHPGEDERIRLRHYARQLNMELAEAYGLPAVHIDR
jgi:hypothetical protein